MTQRCCTRCYHSASENIRGAAGLAAGQFEAYFTASGVSPEGAVTTVAYDCGAEKSCTPEELYVFPCLANRISRTTALVLALCSPAQNHTVSIRMSVLVVVVVVVFTS